MKRNLVVAFAIFCTGSACFAGEPLIELIQGGSCKAEDGFKGSVEDCTPVTVMGLNLGAHGRRRFVISNAEWEKYNQGSRLSLILNNIDDKEQAKEVINMARSAQSFDVFSDTVIKKIGDTNACAQATNNLQTAFENLKLQKSRYEHAHRTLTCPKSTQISDEIIKATR